MAHSPRSWGRALKQHLIDHGGGRIMASIVSPEDAMAEGYDVFLADDTTSFLRAGFISDLRRRNIGVVGVYDPDDGEGTGRQRLLELGVDEIIEADAAPADFVRVISKATANLADGRESGFITSNEDLRSVGSPEDDPYGDLVAGRGRHIVVAGAAGGVGATEIAIGLAYSLGQRGRSSILVDADDVGPSVAQRLGLDIHPNLRTAIDVLRDGTGVLDDVLLGPEAGKFEVLGGLAHRRDWFELRPVDLTEVVLDLARRRRFVVVNVSSRLEDLPAFGGPPRYGVTRSMLALADAVVLVASGTPVGVARVIDWLAEAQALIETAQVVVVINGLRRSSYKAAEIEEELRTVYQPRQVVFIPHDKNLAHATWQGVLPGRGPFTRGVDRLAALIAPSSRRSARMRKTG